MNLRNRIACERIVFRQTRPLSFKHVFVWKSRNIKWKSRQKSPVKFVTYNRLPSSSFCRSLPSWCVRLFESLSIKFTLDGKKKNANLYHMTKFSLYLSFTFHYFYTQISSFMQFFIHKNCFEFFCLLIFYFEKFLAWIWSLPFTVYVKLKLSSIIINISILIIIPCEQAHPRPLRASS